VLDKIWGLPPALDMDHEKSVQAAAREIVSTGLAESCHDIGSGGLAVALAECCFSDAAIGADIQLDSEMRNEFLLFHEGPSRILVSTTDVDAVSGLAAKHSVEALAIGTTREGRLEITNRGRPCELGRPGTPAAVGGGSASDDVGRAAADGGRTAAWLTEPPGS
jgi:phosphoribosylformylglycinamidine synthase